MGNVIVCEGSIVQAVDHAVGADLTGVVICSTGWVIKPEPLPDFQGLVDLLTFSPEICAQLIGICVLFFIIGHSAGHVARNLGRV